MASAKRPNILLITSDQQHWNTIGRFFSEIRTPHLDRLAAQGMVMRRAYCPNPTCTPTRASILTGQNPSVHGAWSLGTKLPESSVTLADCLHEAGYDTALIGKAHLQPLLGTKEFPSLESYPILRDLDFWRGFHGPFYGFRHIETARNHADECHAGQHYALWMQDKGLADWQRHFQNRWGDFRFGDPVNPPQEHRWSLPEEFHTDAWIAERSMARMDHARAEGRPFFLWASFFDPHPPYLVPQPWDSMYDPASLTVPRATPGEFDHAPPHLRETQKPNPDFSDYAETPFGNHGLHSHLHDRTALAKDIAVYYGMVGMMDKSIGKILDHLEATGEAENTLVVFTSDHGHYYGHHGLVAKGPFHFEDGIRVPFLARWPGRIPAGGESDALLSLIDLPVTFLRAAGAPVPSMMQGVDQSAVLDASGPSARDHVLVEFRHQPTTIHMKTLVEDRHKLTVYFNRAFGELYDLENDPGEVRNLWDDPSSMRLREELTRRLLFAQMGAEPLWMPRIAVA
jgi:arylsulfatase A-like enzyme